MVKRCALTHVKRFNICHLCADSCCHGRRLPFSRRQDVGCVLRQGQILHTHLPLTVFTSQALTLILLPSCMYYNDIMYHHNLIEILNLCCVMLYFWVRLYFTDSVISLILKRCIGGWDILTFSSGQAPKPAPFQTMQPIVSLHLDPTAFETTLMTGLWCHHFLSTELLQSHRIFNLWLS